MSKKTVDIFQAYRPKTQEVAVGDDILTLKTATMDQETRFLQLLDGLDIDKLLSAVTSIVPNVGDPEGGGILQIAEAGPQLWDAARNVLGKQFAPAVRDGAIIMLDTYANMQQLLKLDIISEKDDERGSDGEYLGSKSLRAYIKGNLTLLQGVQIVKAAWSLNGYGELLGNIIPLQQAEG